MLTEISTQQLQAMEREILRRAAGEELLVLAAMSNPAQRRRISRELARRCNPASLTGTIAPPPAVTAPWAA